MSRAQLTSTVEQNSAGAAAPFVAGKNVLANGSFDYWQRGTSFTATGYGPDRWYCTVGGSAATFAQETSVVPAGSRYALKWTAGAASSYGQIRQFIEQAAVIPLRGQTVTASAMVQLGASYSGTLQFEIYYSTTTDTVTSFSGSSVSITSTTGTPAIGSYNKITATFTVPSNAVGLYIGVVPTLVQASGISAYIGNVQLEQGSVATPFARAGGTVQGELALCQRYYYRAMAATPYAWLGFGMAYSTTAGLMVVNMPVTMRANPSSIDYSAMTVSTGTGSPTVSSMSINQSGLNSILLAFVSSGLTAYSPYGLQVSNNSSGYVGINAEL